MRQRESLTHRDDRQAWSLRFWDGECEKTGLAKRTLEKSKAKLHTAVGKHQLIPPSEVLETR